MRSGMRALLSGVLLWLAAIPLAPAPTDPALFASISAVLDCPEFRGAVQRVAARAVFSRLVEPPEARTPSAFEQTVSSVHSTRIVAEHTECGSQIAAAMRVPFALADVATTMPPDLVAAIQYVSGFVGRGHELLQQRDLDMQAFADEAHALRHLHRRMMQLAPPHIAQLSTALVPSANLAAFALAIAATRYADTMLPVWLAHGMPSKGDASSSGAWAPYERPAEAADLADYDAHNCALEGSIEERAASWRRAGPASPQWKAHVVAKSKGDEEITLGLADGWYTKGGVDAVCGRGRWHGVRRFVVPQGTDKQGNPKYRVCDDCNESGHNACSTTHEKVLCVGADFPISIAAVFWRTIGSASEMALGTSDMKKAYRQVGVDRPCDHVVGHADPSTGRAIFIITFGHLFGEVLAVNNFNRVPAAIVAVARRLFGFCGGNYFDDYVCCEPTYAGGSGLHVLQCLHRIFGFALDPDKHERMRESNAFLGVFTCLSRYRAGVAILRAKPERITSLVATLKAVRDDGRLTPAQASKLRGKLFFLCLAAFACVGRAPLRAFTARQYSRASGEAASRLDAALVGAIAFFLAVLPSLPSREIQLERVHYRPVLLWTDASWEKGVGALGIVVYLPHANGGRGAFMYSYLVVPAWLIALLVPKAQHIGQLEILAAVCAYLSLPSLLTEEHVIHMVDNTSAIYSLVRGYSSKADSAALVNIFHILCAAIGVRVLWDYIESKANVADLPSRLDFAYLVSLGAVYFTLVLPPPEMWSSPLSAWRAIFTSLPARAPPHRRGARGRGSRRAGTAADAPQ